MLRLALSVFLVLMLANPWQFAPPSDAHEAFVITDLGNIFPVETKPVGGSGSATKSIAYNLMLQGAVMDTIDFNGMILHGDAPTEAEREDLNEWVTIDPTTKHAGAILDGTGITMAVPRFYSTYSYAGSSITETSHNPPVDLINIRGHKTVYGSVTETGVQSGMKFSGTGWSIAKLGPVAGGSYTIQGTVPSGASVQPISSPNNMLGAYYDGSRYVLVDGGSFYASENGKRDWDFGLGSDGYSGWIRKSALSNSWYSSGIDIDQSDLDRKIIWQGNCQGSPYNPRCHYSFGYLFHMPRYEDTTLQTHLPVYVKDTPDISFTSSRLGKNDHYNEIIYVGGDFRYNRVTNDRVVVINDLGFQYDTGVGGSLSDETRTISDGVVVDLVFEHNRHGGYNKITKVAADTSYHQCKDDGPYQRCGGSTSDPAPRVWDIPIEATGSVTIKDTRPYDAHSQYTGNFRQTFYNPSDTYLLVKPGGNTVTVKGVSSSPTSGIVFGLSGAPADSYYSLLAGGTTIYGKTTSSGSIVLREGDITIADYTIPGSITFYPNALKHYDPNFGMVGFDLVNDATFRFGNSPLINVPEDFVKVSAWADVYITDVTLASSSDSVTLHYLSGHYNAGDTITVPYVKLYDDFRMTIDGQVTLPMNFTDVPRVI